MVELLAQREFGEVDPPIDDVPVVVVGQRYGYEPDRRLVGRLLVCPSR